MESRKWATNNRIAVHKTMNNNKLVKTKRYTSLLGLELFQSPQKTSEMTTKQMTKSHTCI